MAFKVAVRIFYLNKYRVAPKYLHDFLIATILLELIFIKRYSPVERILNIEDIEKAFVNK